MIRRTITYASVGFIAAIFLAGCDRTPEAKVASAKQDLKEAKAEYRAEWQKFKTDADQKIDANEKTVDRLEVKMKTAGPKHKAQYKRDIESLDERNRDLKKKLADYSDGGEDKWTAFKQGFSSDMDGLEKALKDFTVDKD